MEEEKKGHTKKGQDKKEEEEEEGAASKIAATESAIPWHKREATKQLKERRVQIRKSRQPAKPFSLGRRTLRQLEHKSLEVT